MKAHYWLIPGVLLLVPLLPSQERAVPGFPAQPLPSVGIAFTAPSFNFGMLGISLGQTLRVVATNVGRAPATASATAVPACGVDVKFFDSDGNQFGLGGHTDSLASGRSFSVELPGPTAAGRSEFRTKIQIVIPSQTGTTAAAPSGLMVCNILSTIQVYDTATGKTDFALAGNPIILSYIPGSPCQKGEVCSVNFAGK